MGCVGPTAAAAAAPAVGRAPTHGATTERRVVSLFRAVQFDLIRPAPCQSCRERAKAE